MLKTKKINFHLYVIKVTNKDNRMSDSLKYRHKPIHTPTYNKCFIGKDSSETH